MAKTHQKKLFRFSFLIIILFISFFCLSGKKAYAQSLEVKYPVISGENLNTDANLTLPKYVLYLFNIGMFIGFWAVFISLLIAGVMYLLSPAKPDLQAEAKDRVGGAISGLLILVLTYLIITTINPQLSYLNFNKTPANSLHPSSTQTPGVYFFSGAGCPSAENVQPSTSSLPDLGNTLRDRVYSVGIVQDIKNQTGYLPILYNTVGLKGKCQILNSNQACQNVDNFAESASVYQYNTTPNGGGVYFYRNSYFNENGGWLEVSNFEIGRGYSVNLNQLRFTGSTYSNNCNVPKDQQDCIKYDKNENCVQKSCPTLAKDNISSVKIDGNYIVLFVYKNPNDSNAGAWTSCQAFPTADDVNKIGPVQIRWESIRNTGKVLPNYLVIIPVKQK